MACVETAKFKSLEKRTSTVYVILLYLTLITSAHAYIITIRAKPVVRWPVALYVLR